MFTLRDRMELSRQKARDASKRRRADRIARGVCINQPDNKPPHGPVVIGGRCEACNAKWKLSR